MVLPENFLEQQSNLVFTNVIGMKKAIDTLENCNVFTQGPPQNIKYL